MYQYEENLPPDAKSRYQKKIEAAGILQCPYKEPAVRWINEPKKWPPTTYKDVYHYLIKSPRKFFSFVYLPQFLSADWIWKGGARGGVTLNFFLIICSPPPKNYSHAEQVTYTLACKALRSKFVWFHVLRHTCLKIYDLWFLWTMHRAGWAQSLNLAILA